MKTSSKIISIRVSEKEFELIKSRADQHGQNISRYMVECATGDHGITQSQKQDIYYRLAVIRDYAKQDKCNEIKKECDQLWQLLK